MSLQASLKGWTGELKTRFAQVLYLDPKEYHTFNNLILQLEIRTTQIDHVIASRYGVFVVETKHMSGLIHGKEREDRWTQTFFRKKRTFQNPLRQNYLHTKSLARYLNLDHDKIHSVVVFWGDCRFKTHMPEKVLKDNYTDYIKSKKEVLLSEDEVQDICSRLQSLKDQAGILSSWHHTRTLKKAFASTTTCPRCGSKLVERKPGNGSRYSKPFLGCSDYPACRYVKNL